jgi:hypothetical protein
MKDQMTELSRVPVGNPIFWRWPIFYCKPAVGKNRGESSGGLRVEAVLISGNSTDQERAMYMGSEPTRPGVWVA